MDRRGPASHPLRVSRAELSYPSPYTAIGEGATTPEALAKRTGAAERGVRILADFREAGFRATELKPLAPTQQSLVIALR